jgi:hypothetical protein
LILAIGYSFETPLGCRGAKLLSKPFAQTERWVEPFVSLGKPVRYMLPTQMRDEWEQRVDATLNATPRRCKVIPDDADVAA